MLIFFRVADFVKGTKNCVFQYFLKKFMRVKKFIKDILALEKKAFKQSCKNIFNFVRLEGSSVF